MTDAPLSERKRTLSERIREGHYFQTPTGTRYRLADEVAALEQDSNVIAVKEWREQYEWMAGQHLAAETQLARLREAIREAIVEIDEARDYVEGTDLARSTLARALAGRAVTTKKGRK